MRVGALGGKQQLLLPLETCCRFSRRPQQPGTLSGATLLEALGPGGGHLNWESSNPCKKSPSSPQVGPQPLSTPQGAPILVHLQTSRRPPQVVKGWGAENPCPVAGRLKSCWGSWKPSQVVKGRGAPNPCPVTNAENAARATPSVTPSKSSNGSFVLRLWGSAVSSKVSSTS